MSKAAQAEMKMFEVGFKEYYHELSSWICERIRGKNEKDALRRFARRHGITQTTGDPRTWRWRENDWHFVFRAIKPATTKPCPHCNGSGQVAVKE